MKKIAIADKKDLSLHCNYKTVNAVIEMKHLILILPLLSPLVANAQEYNNWLLGGGAVLNFDTSPATIVCGKYDNVYARHTVMLSDDYGQVILYGFKNNPPQNANSSVSDFVIKNKQNQTIVSFSCGDLRNVIGCKLPQGGYYIAAVLRPKQSILGELHVYKFDNNANLEQEFVYINGNYTFLIDFIRVDNFIVLVPYKRNQIETYKLTSDGCSLWETSDITLDMFAMLTNADFSIENSIDGSKIFATTWNVAYILDFDKKNGSVSIVDRIESDKFRTMSFSKNMKYFLIIDDGKLKGYLYHNKFDFDFDKPDIVYNLPYVSEIDCDACWEMAVGVDGNLYLHYFDYDYIMVFDGIEDGAITEEIVKSNCLQATFFPRIPRIFDAPMCTASAAFENAFVCHGQPLSIISYGDAPFEISYTIDGEQHNITTSETEYQLPDVAGRYKITKIKDASCEFFPMENNEAEIAPQMKKLRIVVEE